MNLTHWISVVSFCAVYLSGVHSKPTSAVFKCPVPGEVPGLYPDPLSCKHFYQCAYAGTPQEIAVRIPCPSQLSFNVYAKVCDWGYNVECEDGVRPTPPAPTTEEPDGSGDGEVVVPSFDSNYISTGGDVSSKEGTSAEIEEEYIPVTETKRPSPTTSATTPGNSGTFRCPRGSSNELFANPDDCGSYYQCDHVGTSNEVAHTLKCPTGLAFNEAKKYCDWRSNVPGCGFGR